MSKITLNELAALSLVLDSMDICEILHNAMKSLSNNDDAKSQDKANICSQAINTFLK